MKLWEVLRYIYLKIFGWLIDWLLTLDSTILFTFIRVVRGLGQKDYVANKKEGNSCNLVWRWLCPLHSTGVPTDVTVSYWHLVFFGITNPNWMIHEWMNSQQCELFIHGHWVLNPDLCKFMPDCTWMQDGSSYMNWVEEWSIQYRWHQFWIVIKS